MIRALLIDLDGLIRIWDGSDAKAVEERFDLPVGTIPRTAFAPDLLIQAVTAGRSLDFRTEFKIDVERAKASTSRTKGGQNNQ